MNKIRISLLFFVAFGLGSIFLIKHIDKIPPINMATKTCLITGASSGIGKNLAIEMVNRGWKVIGVARRAETLEQLKQKLGVNAFIPFVCNVGDLEQVHATCGAIKNMGLQPTLFFLNAGTGELRQKWQIAVDSHLRTFATNYFGVLAWLEEWLLPVKQLGGGTFVATSSVMALLATPGSDAYAASKLAIKHCFDALRRQYIYDNVGFCVVLPGPTNTEMLKGAGAKSLPFIHQPEDEAHYIVEQVFKRNKQIEPSWFYSIMLRLVGMLPDFVVAKILAK